MTNAEEFNKRLKEMEIDEIVDQLWWCGCDPHFSDIWTSVMIELDKRIDDGRL